MIRYNEIHDNNWVICKFRNTGCIPNQALIIVYSISTAISISMNKLQQHSNAYILYIRHVTLINTIRKLYILHLYCLAKSRKVHINNLLLGIRKLKVQVEKCFQILWLRPFRSIAFMSNRKNKCICLWEILARLTSFIFAKRVYTFCESLIVADSDNDILQNNTVRYIRSICW